MFYCYSVSVRSLTLDLNVTIDLVVSNIETACFNITFNWDWPLELLSLSTWSVFVRYINLSNSQNGNIFIGNDISVVTITGVEFNKSSNFGGSNLTIWLEIDSLLINGSKLDLYSLREIIFLPSCELHPTGVCIVCACVCVCVRVCVKCGHFLIC